jgi:hypothetical protein
MLGNRLIAAWLRLVAGMLVVAGVATLSGCGGGNGAMNNPFEPVPAAPSPIFALPLTQTIYSHTPATVTVTGGVPPYFAFSGNSAVLPIQQAVSGNTILLVANDVATSTPVLITITDSIGQQTGANITVVPAPLLPNLVTITPNNDCPGNPQNLGGALCSGGTGTASVRLTSPGGGALPGRQVRFDVVQGNFAIQSSNPATPLVSTLTVVTDANGNAVVGIAIPVNAVTQIGVIRATDLTTGNQVTGQFTITQVTDGSTVLSVIPNGETTITGPLQGICSSNARVNFYIFGGTPPYTVRPAFPDAVTLVGVPVLTNGGFFTAVTNGTCIDQMQFAITDATGRTIPGGNSPLLTNEPGTLAPPAPPTPTTLTVAPDSVTVAGGCGGKTLQFTVVGGTPPYSASVALTPAPTPPPVVTLLFPGNIVNIAFPLAPPVTGTIGVVSVTDSSSPPQNDSADITCS